LAQSALLLPSYGNAHVAHDAPVQLPRHVHRQVGTLPLTAAEWLLQSCAPVQIRGHPPP
jgi:hypothetical protein